MEAASVRRIGCVVLAASGLVLVFVAQALSFDRYNSGCQTCHGEFTDGTSPKGTIFPSDSKHQMHRASSSMDTACNLCHTSDDGRNPYIGSSDGTSSNPGVGCTGCHGRDYGGSIGNSGVGLRAHHAASGVALCGACHTGDPAPLPENVMPTYFGTVDTHVDDPCNASPDYLENWSIGDTEGLDNDGDDLYDEADSDCGVPLGDMNCDGAFNIDDVVPFVLALIDPGAYGTQYPGCDILNGDFDNSGAVDGLDTQGLVDGLLLP